MTGTKKLAHICGVPGLGICGCSQSVAEVPRGTTRWWRPFSRYLKLGIASSGNEILQGPARGKQNPRPLPSAYTRNRLIRLMLCPLMARAHHHQGNLAETFWENKHLSKDFQELVAAKPFVYEPPRRKRMGGPLLEGRVKKVMTLMKPIQDDCECLTRTMDGWDNLYKLHCPSRNSAFRWLLHWFLIMMAPT